MQNKINVMTHFVFYKVEQKVIPTSYNFHYHKVIQTSLKNYASKTNRNICYAFVINQLFFAMMNQKRKDGTVNEYS